MADNLDGARPVLARLAGASRQEEKRRRLQGFLASETPAWNPDDHIDIDVVGGAAAWVRKLRDEWEESFKKRTGTDKKR
jgi:hypothetical protein